MTFWDKVAGIYDLAESLNGKVYTEMCDTTRRLIPEGAKVLDCAAGTGELTFAAAEKASSVLCTDLSENMLNKAREKAEKLGFSNIAFEKRDIFFQPDPDNTYDVVIAGNVLHLLDYPYYAVHELYRVLKPGGKMLIPTFTTKNKGEVFIKLYKLMGFNPKKSYSPSEYRDRLKGFIFLLNENYDCKAVLKHKLIKGLIPCCYAVITKTTKTTND